MLQLSTVLLAVWCIGVLLNQTFGGFIHVLLIVALMAILDRIQQYRRPLGG